MCTRERRLVLVSLVIGWKTGTRTLNHSPSEVKPRLHERFLSRAGDAIFFRFCCVACAPGWLHLWQILATNWRPRESHTSRDLGTINRHSYFNFIGYYSLVASQARAKSCGVATRATISAILSRKFQLWRLFSCDFFTCRVASSRVTTRAIFILRWRRDKVWKNRITSASKKSLV